MPRRNVMPALAMIAGMLVLQLWVAYRARGFHYCAVEGEQQARVVSSDEPCGGDESPLEWNRQGWPARLKLVGNTARKALGMN